MLNSECHSSYAFVPYSRLLCRSRTAKHALRNTFVSSRPRHRRRGNEHTTTTTLSKAVADSDMYTYTPLPILLPTLVVLSYTHYCVWKLTKIMPWIIHFLCVLVFYIFKVRVLVRQTFSEGALGCGWYGLPFCNEGIDFLFYKILNET